MFSRMLAKLWNDDGGAVITAEWVLVATVLIIGVLTGFIVIRQVVIARALDLASQAQGGGLSYSFSGQANCEAATFGSAFLMSSDTSMVVQSTAAVPGGVSAHACD